MINKRIKNMKIFNDTENLCKSNELLVQAIINSGNSQYVLNDEMNVEVYKEHRFTTPANIVVSKKRSLEAANAYMGLKTCVHNFASFTNPGGGVTKGASAQEEAICRSSTLYFNISSEKIYHDFYYRHRRLLNEEMLDCKYNDDCIFTPEVVVFKSDVDEPELLPEKEWYKVDIITCAAPNLRTMPSNMMNPNNGNKPVKILPEDIKVLHKKRIKRIFDIAKKEQEDVVILGAFGCGAFRNPPTIVADAMAEIIQEYIYDFKTIELAIYCSSKDMKNYDTFIERFSKMM